MSYDMYFITCHRVSPREEKREAEIRDSQRKKQGKAPNPRGKRGHRHANGKLHAGKNGRDGK